MHARRASFITLPQGFTREISFFYSFPPLTLFPLARLHPSLLSLLTDRDSFRTLQPLAGRHNKHIFSSAMEIF